MKAWCRTNQKSAGSFWRVQTPDLSYSSSRSYFEIGTQEKANWWVGARITQTGYPRFECLCQISLNSFVDMDATWTFLSLLQGWLSPAFLQSSIWEPSGKNEYIREHQSHLLHRTRSLPRLYPSTPPQKSELLWSGVSVKVKTQNKIWSNQEPIQTYLPFLTHPSQMYALSPISGIPKVFWSRHRLIRVGSPLKYHVHICGVTSDTGSEVVRVTISTFSHLSAPARPKGLTLRRSLSVTEYIHHGEVSKWKSPGILKYLVSIEHRIGFQPSTKGCLTTLLPELCLCT